MKNRRVFLSENFQFFGGEIFYIFEKACFRNGIRLYILYMHLSQMCPVYFIVDLDHIASPAYTNKIFFLDSFISYFRGVCSLFVIFLSNFLI